MNNSDLNDPDKKSATQEESEQLVWERLQNEALAAQRWRLEQEMKLASESVASASGSGSSFWSEFKSSQSRFAFAAAASFVVASLVFAVYCVV